MYETFYHLQEKPFHLVPDSRFFFSSAGHNRVRAFLRYGVYQSEGFIVVTGDVGTGKTTLIYTLLEELAEQKEVIAAHLATTQRQADELLPLVAMAFGLSHEGLSKAAILERLEKFLLEQARQGKRVLLIVDEAQNLSVEALEALRLLTNYQIGPKALLQGFLVGQAEFSGMLQMGPLEQLRQRVIASCHLGPMNLEETRQYIEHRLGIVGWNKDPAFTPVAYRRIYDYTDGVPRRINKLCDRILLVGYLEESHEVDEQLVTRVTQELNEEFIGTNPAQQELKNRQIMELGASQEQLVLPSDINNCLSLERRLLDFDKRLTSMEQAMVSSGILEEGRATSWKRKMKELQTQLAQAQVDKSELENRLAQAEEARCVLEEEIKQLQDFLRRLQGEKKVVSGSGRLV